MSSTFVEEYISLSHGKTYIRWDNVQTPPQSSNDSSLSTRPILLFIHGATVPSWQFDEIVPELLRHPELQHYRVLRLDLWGHGRSARPNTEYNLDLFVAQVIDVIDRCCTDCKHNIIGIGHSMGSAILSKVVSMKEEKFRSLILVAPMLDYKSLNPHSRLLSLPVFGEILMRNAIVPALKRRRATKYSAIGLPELGEQFATEIQERDGELTFSDMLLRMFRHGAVGDQSSAYDNLAESRNRNRNTVERDGNGDNKHLLNVHVIWGELDAVANEQQILRILRRLGDIADVNETHMRSSLEESGAEVSYKKFDGFEHDLLLSHPKVCAEEIVTFLKRASVV